MKKLVLAMLILLISVSARAQCVAEVKDVIQDQVRGSIIVEVQYKLNGVVVGSDALPDASAIGRTRYLEDSGSAQEIIALAKSDIEEHCGNILIRNATRLNNLKEEQLKIQKELTAPLIAQIKPNAVGWKKTLSQKIVYYKGKEITIEADGTYTVADIN